MFSIFQQLIENDRYATEDRDTGSIIEVGRGAHRFSGTLAEFLEMRLSTLSEG